MTTVTGTTLDDTVAPDMFVGTDGIDTVRYAAATRAVYADLSTRSAYKLLHLLPFGDSITYGVIGSTTDTESGGYRTLLQDRLALADVVVDMVGSARNGPAGIDPDHEGHRGFTLNQLDAIDAGAIAAARPDAILLMAGTNDSAKDTSTTMIADLRALIVSIAKAAPDATLFVASIPPVRVGQQSQLRSDRVDAYNDKMPALITELAAAGRKVVFVDMRDLDVADISAPPVDSGLHPNAGGYAAIADHWYDAMEARLGLRASAIGQDQDRFVSIENLDGSAFADRLTGDAGANRLDGLGGDDRLRGAAGDDVLIGGGGKDVIDGGDGIDTASFSGAWTDYAIMIDAAGVHIADRRAESPDGTDHIIATERFAFANGIFAVEGIANDAPLAFDDIGRVKAAGMLAHDAVGNLFANDTDTDLALGDLLRVTGVHTGIATAAFVGIVDTLTLNGSYGTLTIAIDGSYRYVVDAGRAAALGTGEGHDLFAYRIADASGSVATATLAITVGPPDAPVPPSSILYTRAGTMDGSPLTDDVLNGPAGANSFYFDLAVGSGCDRIERFETVDVLLTSAPLATASDGRVLLTGDGSIDFDGPGGSTDGVTIGGIDPAAGLRSMGMVDGLSVYAPRAVRPSGAIEGTLGADRMIGDIADTMRQVYFVDTALEIGLGNDRIERFGRHDILVTTTALPDSNADGIIDFGSDRILNLPTGNLVVTSIKNAALQKFEFDGAVEHGGVHYYVYSLIGSVAGLADLQSG